MGAWGESARSGLEGFGSCCNPMNVAFGPDNAVYTAEDNTGRIKRYSPEGRLLSLVGSVDLVPGCKNCSIAVSHDGSRVYMLDITRNHIVRMDALAVDETATPSASDKVSQQTSPSRSTATSVVVRGLKALFSSSD
jgi:sugar lactone lactonase YvrE